MPCYVALHVDHTTPPSGKGERGSSLALHVTGNPAYYDRRSAVGSGPCLEDKLMQCEPAPAPQYTLRTATHAYVFSSSTCDGAAMYQHPQQGHYAAYIAPLNFLARRSSWHHVSCHARTGEPAVQDAFQSCLQTDADLCRLSAPRGFMPVTLLATRVSGSLM